MSKVDRVADLRNAKAAGMTAAEAAELWGIKLQSVHQLCSIHGVYLKKVDRGADLRNAKAAGMTAREVAELWGIKLHSVHQLCSIHGVYLKRKTHSVSGEDAAYRQNRDDRIRELAAQGLGKSEISRELGLSRERIRQLCAKINVNPIVKRP